MKQKKIINLQSKLRNKFLKKGVKMIAPETVFLNQNTKIGKNVTIDPYVVISENVSIGNNVRILSFSHLEGVVIENNVKVYYDSDAMITKGITSVVAECFSDIPVKEAKKITFKDFEKLNIQQLLTPQRRNGLGSLIQTISEKVGRLE